MTGRMAAAVFSAVLASSSIAYAQVAPPEHAEHLKPAPTSEAPASVGPAQAKPAHAPPLTDEDRAAAFPDVAGHAVHDRMVNTFVLFDQMEWQAANGRGVFNWDTKGWAGGDVHRLWFRTEGAADEDGVDHAEAHVLYGRAIARWWDLVAGVRQDIRPGPGRTSAAFGIQGLAPYWFEIEATGYVGEGGRTHARFEAEYDALITNRLILQPLIELEFYGRSDLARRIGAGFSTVDLGFRLRYEIRRELAPYVGFTWQRKLGGTADLARSAGEDPGAARLLLGLRTWF